MTFDEILDRGLDGADSCSHVPKADSDRVRNTKKAVLWADMREGWGPEHDMVALVELTDGFAVIHEGEDTTGYGCQCSADLGFYQTLDEAIRLGLQESERVAFQKAAR